MDINKTLEGNKLVVKVAGRMDSVSAPELEAALNESLDGVEELVFDFSELGRTALVRAIGNAVPPKAGYVVALPLLIAALEHYADQNPARMPEPLALDAMNYAPPA